MAEPNTEPWDCTFRRWVSEWRQEGKSEQFSARAEFRAELGERRFFQVVAYELSEERLDALRAHIESLGPGSDVHVSESGRHAACVYELVFEDSRVELEEVANILSG